MLQFIFWCAVLSAIMGVHSPDGNLFFFFSVHLIMVSTGLFLRRREKRVCSRSTSNNGGGKTLRPVPGTAAS